MQIDKQRNIEKEKRGKKLKHEKINSNDVLNASVLVQRSIELAHATQMLMLTGSHSHVHVGKQVSAQQ